MVDDNVWKKQNAPRGVARLKFKVIFEDKANQLGELVRAKCRLVGQGNRQKPGRDFLESWADMPAAATTRCLLATAAARGWHVHHLDIRSAYVYAPMDMEVYITIPEGFDDAGEDALLVYAMYGTKQAGSPWGKHLSGSLEEAIATRLPAERCLVVYNIGGDIVYVEAHVDDLIVAGANIDAVQKVKKGIEWHYQVRDLGKVSNFLGMEVKWDREAGTVSLANLRHIMDLLKDYQLDDCSPFKTPMPRGVKFGAGSPLAEGNRYAELRGSLIISPTKRDRTLPLPLAACLVAWRTPLRVTGPSPRGSSGT